MTALLFASRLLVELHSFGRNIVERPCLFSQSDDVTSAASTALSNVVNSSHQSTKTSVGLLIYDGSSSMLAISED